MYDILHMYLSALCPSDVAVNEVDECFIVGVENRHLERVCVLNNS
jgi:hypothetical protein